MVRFCRAALRLDLILVVGSALLLPAHGAEIGPGNAPVCELKLEGAIEAGDSDKLSAALSTLAPPAASTAAR